MTSFQPPSEAFCRLKRSGLATILLSKEGVRMDADDVWVRYVPVSSAEASHELGLQERERGVNELLAGLRRSNAELAKSVDDKDEEVRLLKLERYADQRYRDMADHLVLVGQFAEELGWYGARDDRSIVTFMRWHVHELREQAKAAVIEGEKRIAELEQRAAKAESFQRAAEAETTRLGQRALRAEAERDDARKLHSYEIGQCRLAADEATALHNKKIDEILDRAEKAEYERYQLRSKQYEHTALVHTVTMERDQAVKERDAWKERHDAVLEAYSKNAGKAAGTRAAPTPERVYGPMSLTLAEFIERSRLYESWGVETVVEIATHLREVLGEADKLRKRLCDMETVNERLPPMVEYTAFEAVAIELKRLRDGVEACARHFDDQVMYHLSEEKNQVMSRAYRARHGVAANTYENASCRLRALLATTAQPASVVGEVVEPAKVAKGQVWRRDHDGSEWRVEDIHFRTLGLRRQPEDPNPDVGYLEWWADMRGHTLVEESNGLAAGDCGDSEGRERSDDH